MVATNIHPAPARDKPFSVVLMTIYSVENAGIRYVSAALQRAGIETTIIFLRDWRHNMLEMPSETEIQMALGVIREKRADLVGLGFMSSLFPMAKAVTDRIKAAFPTTPIVWGGIHPTSCPEECIPYVDFVCVGEGEQAAIDLAERLRDGGDVTNIDNVYARVNEKIFVNKPRPLIKDMDWLPYPDTADENKYYIEAEKMTIEEPWKRGAEYRIYFSRGCPYNCSYCYVSILRDVYDEKGKEFYRARSVEHILGELEHMKKTFPKVARIKIDDDTSFAFGQAWMDEFLAKYPSRIGIPFECLLIPPMLREDMLWKLKEAGLIRVQTGIESGSSKESKEIHNRSPGNQSILKFGEYNKKLKRIGSMNGSPQRTPLEGTPHRPCSQAPPRRETARGFEVRRIDMATSSVVWAWSSQDAYDDGLLAFPGGADRDPFHANSVSLETIDGAPTVVVNLRDTSQIFGIDPDNGALRWKLGQQGDFALVDADGAALGDEAWWTTSHAPELFGDKLLIFDNGGGREGVGTQVREYTVDYGALRATPVWSWTRERWHDGAWGDVDRLDPDTVLITENRRAVAVLTADSTEAWSIAAGVGRGMYRSERIDACELLVGRCD